jgi:selenocysteine lyase/cysteine desulfurase
MLFNIGEHPSDRVGRFLSERNICVRSGYHCAPLGHKALGTPKGGAVRVSFGIFNREYELDLLLRALRDFVNQ